MKFIATLPLLLVVSINLPSHHLTPGFRNPFVKQSTINSTICIPGYSKSVRPPTKGYTRYLKGAELRYDKLPGVKSDYELDHLIPLSLGGSPFDTRNLWMEPKAEADKSDPLELKLHRQVCKNQLTLKEAQTEIISYKRKNG